MGPETLGAYGFRLVPAERQARLPDLGPVEPPSPSVTVDWRHACALVERAELTADRVAAGDRAGPSLDVRRDPASITFGLPEPVTPEAVVHPLLTPPISILARWRGDLTLHAGGFFAAGRAWGVVGGREAGKSTTLTMLAERGVPLLADDLLVLDGDVVRAGPRCVDLRPDIARRVPAARSLGEVAGRERFRLRTPEAPARAPLAGFFLMDWSEDGERIEIERLPAKAALEVVYEHEYMGLLGPADPRKVLDLLGTPIWRIRRPREWGLTDAVIDRLLDVAAG
jgi:hypothetical protein